MNEKELVLKWLDSIIKMAGTRKTANGATMCAEDTLEEIEVLAKDAKEYVKQFITDDHIKKAEDFFRTKIDNEYYYVIYRGTLDDLIWEYKNWMER